MPSAKYKDTRTPTARKIITGAVHNLLSARELRDQALRQAYAAGVEHRDLVELLEEAGGKLSRQQVARIVKGARDQNTT